jgi:hypothetical protein
MKNKRRRHVDFEPDRVAVDGEELSVPITLCDARQRAVAAWASAGVRRSGHRTA